tara:strand:+ start:462 stop:881 length:420 start_codon:yes stop_codon:yes gene_type:complete
MDKINQRRILKQKLNSRNIFYLHSKFWFWTFIAGGCFWLGYSITKNILISTIFIEHSDQQNLVYSSENQNLLDLEKNLIKIIYVPDSDNYYRKLKIKYNQEEHSKNQAVFKKRYTFFQEENVYSLMKALNNTKKLNLLK